MNLQKAKAVIERIESEILMHEVEVRRYISNNRKLIDELKIQLFDKDS